MDIAILYIATKRYVELWDQFYTSSEKYLLNDHNKHYFIFTDNPEYFQKHKMVTVIPIEDASRHQININRFSYFVDIQNILNSYDYCFFFNGNIEFLGTVDDILPHKENNYLLCTKINIPNSHYARIKLSKAYIKEKDRRFYCRGGIIGGRTKDFLDVCRCCMCMINKDKLNGLLTMNVTDEDYYTKVVQDKNPLSVYFNGTNGVSNISLRCKSEILGFEYINSLK